MSWVDSDGATCELCTGDKISAEALAKLEADLGYRFPEDYVEQVTGSGLLHIERRAEGRVWALGQMLGVAQISKVHRAFQQWVDPDDFGDDEDDRKAALAEQSLRAALIPFQLMFDGSATDVYCFVRGREQRGRPLIVAGLHDDYEISIWIDDDEIVGDGSYGFTEHVERWLASRRSE